MSKRRNSVSDPASRKRSVSFAEPRDEVFHIKCQNQADLPPIIATTPGITVPTHIPFDLYTKTQPRQPKPAIDSGFALHSSRHARIDYEGLPETDDGSANHLNHYVAVYDPDTGSLNLMPAPRLTVRASIRRDGDDEDETERIARDPALATFRQQRDALGNQFGTTKTKKAISARQVNMIGSGTAKVSGQDNITSAMLETVSEAASSVLDRKTLQNQVDNARPIPRPNLNASAVADVYRPDVIMGADNLRSLSVHDWVRSIKESEDILVPSQFVAVRIAKYVQALEDEQYPDAIDATTKLKLLRYLLFLIELYTSVGGHQGPTRRPKRWPRREDFEKMHPGSAELSKRARRVFSDNNEISRWSLDYMVAHMAAITLLVDNFETDTFELHNDIGLERFKVVLIYRELGARITEGPPKRFPNRAEAALHKTAKLRLPIQFPKLNIPSKKQG